MFLKDFVEFERQIRAPGLINALAQSVLQLTSPGVPDIYQGNELWQFTLVDPDNRQPLDFNCCQQAMEQMETLLAPHQDRLLLLRSLISTMEDGRIKLFIVTQILRFRQRHATLFQSGDYLKINILGAGAEHLLAFARKDQNDFALIVVPRLLAALWKDTPEPSLNNIWSDTWLELPAPAPEEYRELFSQCRVTATPFEDQFRLYLPASFGLFPFAVLSAPV